MARVAHDPPETDEPCTETVAEPLTAMEPPPA